MDHDAHDVERLRAYDASLEQRMSHAHASEQTLIAEFRQALQAALAIIQAGEARYQDLFESAPNGYLITDQNGLILDANSMAGQMLNVPAAILLDRPLHAFVAQMHQELLTLKLTELEHKHHLEAWTLMLHPASGSPFYVSVHVSPLRPQGGQAETYRWLLQDVTPQVEIEQELRRTLNFEAILRSITDHVRNSLDEAQILQTVVQDLSQILGLNGCIAGLYTPESQISTIEYECALSLPAIKGTVVRMEKFAPGYRQLLQGQHFQFCMTQDQGPSLRSQVAILACPIVDNQQTLGDLWLFRSQETYFDISEMRLVRQVANQCAIAIRQARLYRAAQDQVEAMEALNRLKDEFLSTVSHELRTPVTNMKMALRMLERVTEAEKRNRYMQILQDECDREVELITNLLDLQRLQAESFPHRLAEAIDLQDWLPRWIEPWQARMQDRQQQLKVDLAKTLPVMVSDRASLGRLLTELLNNAYKYTPKGGTIALSAEGNPAPNQQPTDKAQPAQVTLVIQNSVEIPQESLPYLFDKFYRVPSNNPWSQGGTGLGLALVKQLVEFMRGEIDVVSQAGWTTFTIQLPTHITA